MRISNSFKFIHAADLHLDSPFRIHHKRSPELGALLSGAALEALTRLCDLAIEQKVDFIVLAGDIYDGIERGIRAQLRLQREMTRLKDHSINAYLVYGNHDPVDISKSMAITWPENVFHFPTSPKTYSFHRGGSRVAEITGISYKSREEQRNLAQMFPDVTSSEVFQIAVLHANIGGSSEHANYAPALISDLVVKGYDYWALGHIHKRSILSENPLVIYPGNIQGLHLKPSERGMKGAELVEVSPSGVKHRSVPLASVYFDNVVFDASGYDAPDLLVDEVVGLILATQRETYFSKPLILRLEFQGSVSEECYSIFLDTGELLEELSDRIRDLTDDIFIDSIALKFSKSRTLEDLVSLSDVVGELINEIEIWGSSESQLKEFTFQDSSKKNVLAKLKKAGLSELFTFTQDDLISATRLLAQLFSEGDGQ